MSLLLPARDAAPRGYDDQRARAVIAMANRRKPLRDPGRMRRRHPRRSPRRLKGTKASHCGDAPRVSRSRPTFHPDRVMDGAPESRWIEGPKPARSWRRRGIAAPPPPVLDGPRRRRSGGSHRRARAPRADASGGGADRRRVHRRESPTPSRLARRRPEFRRRGQLTAQQRGRRRCRRRPAMEPDGSGLVMSRASRAASLSSRGPSP